MILISRIMILMILILCQVGDDVICFAGGGGGGGGRYMFQDPFIHPFIQPTLSHTILTPICIRNVFFLRERNKGRFVKESCF